MKKSKALYLYYDGACHLCSKEINHYKSIDKGNVLGLIDISEEGFDPVKEGIPEVEFDKYFHVKRANGEVLAGVKAFQAIWDELGVMRPLSFMANTRLGLCAMNSVYEVFAFARPYLPKKSKEECRI